jgi:hypothetical protein
MCECVASVAENESSPVPIHSATRGGRVHLDGSIDQEGRRASGPREEKGITTWVGLQSRWWMRPTLAASCGYVRMGAETP